MYNQGINVPINLNLSELQSKLSTTATLGTEESGRCGEMAVMGRWGEGCNMTPAVLFSFFLGGGGGWSTTCLFSRSMLTVPYNGNPIINDHKFNDYSTSARWIWDGRQPAIIISYPTSASGIIVLLKTRTKYREFLFVKTAVFQLVSNFERTRTVTIFGEHGIMAHIPDG